MSVKSFLIYKKFFNLYILMMHYKQLFNFTTRGERQRNRYAAFFFFDYR